MKKLLFLSAIFMLAIAACGNKNNAVENTSSISPNNEKSVSVSTDEQTGGSTLLTKDVFLAKVWDYNNSPQEWKYKGDKPAIVDFYADWCGPCKIAGPILEEISNEYAGKIHVYKIDTQKERELASVFGIQSIPAFLYIPVDGKPIMMAGIGRSKAETKNMFKENIDKYLLEGVN